MPRSNRVKLTERLLASWKPDVSDGREAWLYDSEIVGLGVRQQQRGEATFVLRYKQRPKVGPIRDRKHTIGKLSIGLEMARKIARQKMGEVAEFGEVENVERQEMLHHTIENLVDRVVEELEGKGRAPTYIRDFKQQMRDHVLPTIGTMLVADVTNADVDRLLQRVSDRPYLHGRVRAALMRTFTLARRWTYRPDNPAEGSVRMHEAPRERVLTTAEVDRLLKALEGMPGMEADFVRLLYLTGSRPKELFTAKWTDFDLTNPEKPVWTKPAQYVKQKRKHRVEIHKLAVAVLDRRRSVAGNSQWVFPSRKSSKDEDLHLTTIKDFWPKLTKAAGIDNSRPYDLRKSFASRLLAAGVDVKTAMSLTGHTQVAVFLKHYAHLMQDKQGEALEKVFG